MNQEEFERSRTAQVKALRTMNETPSLTVVDVVEILLEENPSLPVVVQVGAKRLPILCLDADEDRCVIQVGSPSV